MLHVDDIADATGTFFYPPAIRTKKGELIFVPKQSDSDHEKCPPFTKETKYLNAM